MADQATTYLLNYDNGLRERNAAGTEGEPGLSRRDSTVGRPVRSFIECRVIQACFWVFVMSAVHLSFAGVTESVSNRMAEAIGMLNRKARIGDICEIRTPAGLAYLQYTHDGGNMAELVRVLPGVFNTRPTDFADIAKQRELYFVFYTLDYALGARDVAVVSNQPIPGWAQPYPLMRWAGAQDQHGRTVAWKILKASDPLTLETHQRIPVIRTLTPEQEKLSLHQLWPHAVMVKELARGWTPERAEELRLQDVAEAAARKKERPIETASLESNMRHFLYFSDHTDAQKAAERLRSRGFSVDVRKSKSGQQWLALASGLHPKTGEQMEKLRDDLEALAAETDGEYDGWETSDSPDGEQSQSIN
jgi:Regulator of ribonuclease activity B